MIVIKACYLAHFVSASDLVENLELMVEIKCVWFAPNCGAQRDGTTQLHQMHSLIISNCSHIGIDHRIGSGNDTNSKVSERYI